MLNCKKSRDINNLNGVCFFKRDLRLRFLRDCSYYKIYILQIKYDMSIKLQELRIYNLSGIAPYVRYNISLSFKMLASYD